jgi:hypothetical protein
MQQHHVDALGHCVQEFLMNKVLLDMAVFILFILGYMKYCKNSDCNDDSCASYNQVWLSTLLHAHA